ncbi:hypothetical protein KY290_021585 [Solanum tuberosum]|uniref:Uncharacterized protein n=1 Tax=Solanum tuberosum TaxID=4113 RepID=A0ABQ7V419_SOLTU|nr:hypothetical protein KY289_020745 [Solanum tuberosum]KAH0758092.1 hypothetical protein KY290_021585 [Solanum tuberosum]
MSDHHYYLPFPRSPPISPLCNYTIHTPKATKNNPQEILNTPMANPLIAYSDDEISSASTALPSAPISFDVHYQGGENHSTNTSLTSLPKDPSPTRPPSPLSAFASSDPFTPSPLPPSSKTPNPKSAIFPSMPPIETHIPTTTTTCPCKHIIVKQTSLRTPFTRSAGQEQLKEAMESSTKCRRVSKSPVQPFSCPVMLDSESEEVSASLYHLPLPPSQKLSKNMVKFLEIGKEKYFCTKPMLRGHSATSIINVVELVFDHISLGEILNIPTNGLAEYVWLNDEHCLLTSKYSQGRVSTRAMKGHRRHAACFCDMGIAHALENKKPIDWPSFMIKHMAGIGDPQPSSHQLSYGNLLTIVFKEFVVPLGEGNALTHAYMFTSSSLAECGLLAEPDQVPIASPRASGPVASLLRDLRTARD